MSLYPLSTEAHAVLRCPHCEGPLGATGALECSTCGLRYSFVGDLPCLVPDPAFWRARTRQRLNEYLEYSAARLAALELEQRNEALDRRTRMRIGRIVDGLRIERDLFERTLAPLRERGVELPQPSALTHAPGAGGLELFTCYEHLFRDWNWGETESRAALSMTERLATRAQARGKLGQLAVLGAGAGRLAADIHQQLEPAQTFALDLNPLPLLIAQQLVQGARVEASEFPVAPRSANDVAVARTLSCPYPVRPGLTYLLGDGLSPPFASGSLDTVVTPWFIDAVDADPRVTAYVINRVLKPGGVWLNFGPLRFNGPTARLYAIEEVLAIVGDSGFSLEAEEREQVPYFAMPESGFHRFEFVYGFAARKTALAPAFELPANDPPWILDPTLPVPDLPEWPALKRSAMLAGAVAAMVDGQSTIADMSDALAAHWGVEPRALDAQLQAFLSRFVAR